MISGPTHTAFHHFAHSQLLRDLLQIAGDPALELHYRGTADYFQILDPGQVRQQFVLDTISKVSVFLRLTQIFQRQNRDTLSAGVSGSHSVGGSQSAASRPNPGAEAETKEK